MRALVAKAKEFATAADAFDEYAAGFVRGEPGHSQGETWHQLWTKQYELMRELHTLARFTYGKRAQRHKVDGSLIYAFQKQEKKRGKEKPKRSKR